MRWEEEAVSCRFSSAGWVESELPTKGPHDTWQRFKDGLNNSERLRLTRKQENIRATPSSVRPGTVSRALSDKGISSVSGLLSLTSSTTAEFE